MAKEEEKKDSEEQAQATEALPEEKGKDDSKKQSGSMLVWIIMAAVVGIGAGGGYGLASLLATSNCQTEQQEEVKEEEPAEDLIGETEDKYEYSLDPVVSCLDEPSLSRYVRVSITMQMVSGFDPTKGEKFLDDNKAILRDWMTTYLAGLTLVQVQGSKNLERIKMEIFEEFNQILFPDKKPLIERILFKEFVVQ